MDRDEVHGRPDVARRELVDDPVAPDGQRLRHEPQDIEVPRVLHLGALHRELERVGVAERLLVAPHHLAASLDRKSTRLNSSHGYISYAVFCLKKKKKYGYELLYN